MVSEGIRIGFLTAAVNLSRREFGRPTASMLFYGDQDVKRAVMDVMPLDAVETDSVGASSA